MPTLKYRTVNPVGGFLSGPIQEPYWENDAAVSSASTQAVTNDELNLMKKKRRRSLTVPLDVLAQGGDGSRRCHGLDRIESTAVMPWVVRGGNDSLPCRSYSQSVSQQHQQLIQRVAERLCPLYTGLPSRWAMGWRKVRLLTQSLRP